MSDLLDRLWAMSRGEHDDLSIGDEAAARILELEAKNKKLKEALKPFGDEAEGWDKADFGDSFVPMRNRYTVGDLRRAAALGEKP